MTDEQDDEGPDGIIVIHFPADGSAQYGVGPFPPIPDLVDAIILNGPCSCRKEPLPIVFPKGITMAVDASAVAEGIAKGIFGATAADAPLVVVLPAGIVEGVEKQRAERREKKERMN